ncbi:splicing regulator SDE2-like isoform X2 [Glandiceps talaboti]
MSVIYDINGKTRCLQVGDGIGDSVHGLKVQVCQNEGCNIDDIYLVQNGRRIQDDVKIQEDVLYHVCYRLPGGKGGFGSMLRMIGAQIEKTTNREACRDLSGRRLRDINDEKRLSEWLKKQADKEREREVRRREKLEKMASEPRHFFNDQKYEQQKQSIMENVSDALSQGIQAAASEESSKKRKTKDTEGSGRKKQKFWLGIDVDIDSDLSSDEDGDDDDEEETEEDREMKELCQKYVEKMKHEGTLRTDANTEVEGQPGTSADTAVREQSHTETEPNGNNQESLQSEVHSDSPTTATSEIDNSQEKKQGQSLLSMLPPPNSEKEEQKEDRQVAKEESQVLEPVNLEEYQSASELESLGLDRLKATLMKRGLKCGGTLQERATRLYSVKGLEKHQIDASLFAKPAKGKTKGSKRT